METMVMNSIWKKNSSMKTVFTYIFLCLAAFLCSCKTRNHQNDPGVTIDNFRILWKTSITNGPAVLGLNPILFDSLVIMNTEYDLYGDQAAILFFDTVNGEIIDTWSDYIDGVAVYTSNCYYDNSDYLVLHTKGSTDCLNIRSKQRQWASKTNNKQSAYIYGNNGFVYTSHMFGEKTASVLRTPIDQNNWETFYTFTANGKMRPFFDGFGFGNLPNGDEIVLWQNRTRTPIDRMEVFAFNITADSLLWRNRDFLDFEVPFPPKVYNGKVYGALNDGLYCLDLETGETLWTRGYNSVFDHYYLPWAANYIGFYNDQLIVHGYGSKVLYLSPEDGSIFKAVDGYPNGHGEGDYSYYQGKLYFSAAAQLVITDITTGENLATPAKLGELNDIEIRSSITIDPETGKLYFQDGYYLYCVKQPKVL